MAPQVRTPFDTWLHERMTTETFYDRHVLTS
jgi:hypothetical protein